jgi:hypothetical protein
LSVVALIEFYFKLIICITIPEEPKNRGFEAIVYIHNEIFMDIQRRKPKIMLTIYDDKVIELLRDHRADAITRNMPRIQRIIGIDDFLTYLQEELEKMALLD